jgi:hypothetical protein
MDISVGEHYEIGCYLLALVVAISNLLGMRASVDLIELLILDESSTSRKR